MSRPRELSINGRTQRFSISSTLSIVLSSILISISSHWAFNLCPDPIVISSVLATFKLNLLTLSQHVRLLISEVTASLRSTTVFADIEDITCPRVDMNFIFECSTRYLTSERSERVRYRVEHEKIKFLSTSGHVILFII